jgi:hypothetical protein
MLMNVQLDYPLQFVQLQDLQTVLLLLVLIRLEISPVVKEDMNPSMELVEVHKPFAPFPFSNPIQKINAPSGG